MRLATPSTPTTDASETQQTLRELDRRTATAASGVGALGLNARHSWSWPSGTVNVGLDPVQATGWNEVRNDGLVTFDPTTSRFTLNRGGRWAIHWKFSSDCTVAGTMAIWLRWETPNPLGGIGLRLQDTRYRGAGFAGSGFLDQNVNWVGWVATEEAASPISAWTTWYSGGSTAATLSYHLNVTYLGGEGPDDAPGVGGA